jgi:hypothetical protein
VGVWVAWREIACFAIRTSRSASWSRLARRKAALGCATGGGLLWRGNRRTFGLGMADLRTWLKEKFFLYIFDYGRSDSDSDDMEEHLNDQLESG